MKNRESIEAFGLRLRKLREQYSMSQQELADQSDIDKKTIQRIENGRLNPSLDTLISLAKGFGIEVGQLMGK